ncbi:MAG TPA: hypothetical protein VFT52_08105 [Luteimonas sp.]|nr:hypothetical protein [Luteimonas sp.]
MARRSLPLALVAVAVLALPAATQADPFHQVFREYQRTGAIDGCHFSAQALKSAKAQVPNDIQQYAPDFPDALDAAIAQRASGACGKGASKTTAVQPAPAATTTAPAPPPAPAPAGGTAAPQPAAPVPAAPVATVPQPTPSPVASPAVVNDAIPAAARSARSDSGTPAPLIVLLALAALALLAGATWSLARWWAYDAPWLAGLRHATGEAGWRTSAAWAEFTDWLRLGR